MNKVERTFSSLVRMPYQNAIAVVLHVYDFHIEMAAKTPAEKEFHIQQANKLRSWLSDIKDYIERKERE